MNHASHETNGYGGGYMFQQSPKPPKKPLFERLANFGRRVAAAVKAFDKPGALKESQLRYQPLGFLQHGIRPGAIVEVVSRPQVILRGEKVIVSKTVGRYFTIVDLKVGGRSQLVNSTELPASLFVPPSAGIAWKMDPAEVAQDITFVVRNRSKKTRTFRATIVGTVVL